MARIKNQRTHCLAGHEYTEENSAYNKDQRFCRQCRKDAAIARKNNPVISEEAKARFWSRVDKSAGCWIWQGLLDAQGYGIYTATGFRGRAAHRFAFTISNGPIPTGFEVLHKCDNPRCVNPAHLQSGTHGDNMRDMCAKGRQWLQARVLTHCKWGHEFTPDNTMLIKATPTQKERRQCRVCMKARSEKAKLVKVRG